MDQTPTEEALALEKAAGKREGIDQCRSVLVGEIRRLRALQAKEFEGGRDRVLRTLSKLERRLSNMRTKP